jgi:aspartate-semialdehyde dehydrogenase
LNALASGVAVSQFDLAVLGADSPLGEAVLAYLDEREVAVGRLFALTLQESEESVSFRGQDWPCEAAAGFDFAQAQALIVASRGAATQLLVARVRAERPMMPIIEADAIDPAAAVVAARVLKPIAALAGLVSADAFVTLPVALAGKEGVDELVEQTRGLFNMENPEAVVFPQQIAFNLLPRVGDASPGSEQPDYETRLAQATARLANGMSVGFSATTGALFFGAAMALHVRTEQVLDIAALRNALQRQDGITLMEDEHPAAMPTPATDALGSQDVFVGKIRVENAACRLWLVFDPITLDAVQLAASVENWIDKPASSLIT